MIRSGADDSDIDTVALVPSGEAINDVYSVAGVQIVDRAFSIDFPDLT